VKPVKEMVAWGSRALAAREASTDGSFIYGWVGEPTWLTTGSTRVSRVLGRL